MHLLVEQLGDVDELVVEAADFVVAPERVEQDRLGNSEVDSLEEAHVADVLPAALADDRQHAEIVAIVEHGREVVRDRQVGRIEIAGHDRDRVGVDALPDTAEIRLIGNRQAPGLLSDDR